MSSKAVAHAIVDPTPVVDVLGTIPLVPVTSANPTPATVGQGMAVPRVSLAKPATSSQSCGCGKKRNLVVCIDGTSNQFSNKNTNVVELYSRLIKDSDQLTFYNSGIGTYATPSWKSPAWYKQVLAHKLDLAIAWRFERILLSAYLWLSDNYQEGDRIFLFGFSRGAYQVRALSAMIEAVGLIHKGNEGQIPFAYQLYRESPEATVNGSKSKARNTPGISPRGVRGPGKVDATSDDMPQRFKETFSRHVKVHFVGVWDTVSSVGIIRGRNLPGTADGMRHVCVFRHALALHERRVKFLPEYIRGGLGPGDSSSTNAKEIWFAGCHSDIGGGVAPNKDLKRFGPALRWMYLEAESAGIRLSKAPRSWDQSTPALDNRFIRPVHWLMGAVDLEDNSPRMNESLSGFWRVLEVFCFKRPKYGEAEGTTWWPHAGHPRVIVDGQQIHVTAQEAQYDSRRARVLGSRTWEDLLASAEADPFTTVIRAIEIIREHVENSGALCWRDVLEPISALEALVSTYTGSQYLRDIEADPLWNKSVFLALLSLRWELVGMDRARLLRVTSAVLQELNHKFPIWELREALAASAIPSSDPTLAADLLNKYATTELRPPLRGDTSAVMSVAFLSDGRRLVSSSHDTTLRIWDVKTGETVIGPLEGHTNTVPRVAVHGSRIASCSYDGTFRVWDADSGELILGSITAHYGERVQCIAYSRNGTRIATAGDDNRAAIWDAETGAALHEMVGHTAPVTCVAFSEDGTRLVSGSQDTTIRIWDVASGECIGEPFTGNTDWVHAVCFSRDDRRIFFSSEDFTIRIWDAETRALIVEPLRMDDQVLSMALSPDGKRLVSGSHTGSIAMWDAETGAAIQTPFRDHGAQVWSLAFSPDGRKIASASGDETIALWDATDDWKRWDIADDVENDDE